MYEEFTHAVMASVEDLVPQEVDPTPRYSSSNFGWCDRKTLFKRMGKPGIQQHTFESECRMEVGKAIHEVVQRRVQRKFPNHVLVEFEHPLDLIVTPQMVLEELGQEPLFFEPTACSCRPDLILIPPSNDAHAVIVDIKSGNDKLFDNEIKEGYQIQTALYWRRFIGSLWEYIETYLYRVNRGLFSQRGIAPLQDPKTVWLRALALINQLEGHVARGTLPPIPATMYRSGCLRMGCEYYSCCW